MTKPSFNPMIGPSNYILINMGARFVPCMHTIPGVQDSTNPVPLPWPCPNSTSNIDTAPENQCTLSELCGFGGIDFANPNQWFRFIIPIFMHAGLIHIGFNMLLQLTLGRDMEKSIGSIRFFLVYMSAGIFGFVMGGNFAATAIASTGASGSLFGVIALTLLDLLYSWRDRVNPVKDLAFIILDVVISFVLGLLPGLDNFSHIGGFLMGLGLGVCILHSPNSLRRRIGEDVPYAREGVSGGSAALGTPPSFLKNPIGFFKGRKPLWWAWWLIRAGALVAVLVVFILLLNNFYVYRVTCSWCKYLSCLVSLTLGGLGLGGFDGWLLMVFDTARQQLVRDRQPPASELDAHTGGNSATNATNATSSHHERRGGKVAIFAMEWGDVRGDLRRRGGIIITIIA